MRRKQQIEARPTQPRCPWKFCENNVSLTLDLTLRRFPRAQHARHTCRVATFSYGAIKNAKLRLLTSFHYNLKIAILEEIVVVSQNGALARGHSNKNRRKFFNAYAQGKPHRNVSVKMHFFVIEYILLTVV